MSNKRSLAYAQDLGSEFEYDNEKEKKKRARHDLALPESSRNRNFQIPSKQFAAAEYDREESQRQRYHFLALDAYGRHKQLINTYVLYYQGATKDLFKRDSSKDKTDLDIIRENSRFLWSDADNANDTWAKRLAKKYWDKLFKEYCITDLSRYKENKIALRWRVEKEVAEGKGQFICGNKRCEETDDLRTWEVNFGYMEHGEKKNALVKLRLCPDCSYKLNYHHKRKEVTKKPKKPPLSEIIRKKSRQKRKHKEKSKKKRKRKTRDETSSSSSSSSSEEEEKIEEAAEREKSDADFWKGPAPLLEEKSREEEFDEYLQDMFL